VNAATDAWLHTATYTGGPAAAFFSSFIVAGGRIYTGVFFQIGTYLPRYFAFDATDGHLLWSRPGNGMTTPPSPASGALYVTEQGFASQQSYAIDPARGAMVRSFPAQLGDWHSAGARLYAMAITKVDWTRRLNVSTRFLAYDLSGRVIWTAPDEAFGAALPDRVFTLAPEWSVGNSVTARRVVDGRLLWQATLPPSVRPAHGHIVATGGLLFVQGSDGTIAVLDASSGWLLRMLQPPFKGMLAANLLVGDGMVYESVTPRVVAANGTFLPEPMMTLAFGL
jgi:outer membrane protein assembly factor BamB